MKKLHEFFDAELLTKVLKVLGVVVVILFIFGAGMIVGFNKANFGGKWGKHYKDNFGMGYPRGGMMGDFSSKNSMMGFFPNAHGAIGKIIKIQLPSIIVLDKDNLEKVINITDDTEIEQMRTDIKSSELKVDDFIVVIGSPNDKGQIEAKLIRVMPSPDLIK